MEGQSNWAPTHPYCKISCQHAAQRSIKLIVTTTLPSSSPQPQHMVTHADTIHSWRPDGLSKGYHGQPYRISSTSQDKAGAYPYFSRPQVKVGEKGRAASGSQQAIVRHQTLPPKEQACAVSRVTGNPRHSSAGYMLQQCWARLASAVTGNLFARFLSNLSAWDVT